MCRGGCDWRRGPGRSGRRAGAAAGERRRRCADGSVERAALQLRRLHQHRRQHGSGEPDPRGGRRPAADGTQCLTSTTGGTTPDPAARLLECRWNRLDALFKFLSSKGVDSVELFGHGGLPANETIEGQFGWKAYRALLDKYDLHAAGWHGSLNEAAWPARVAAAKIIGLDYIGTGNGQADGTNLDSYDSILRSAEALNRLGKYSVENGVGPVYVHNHTNEFDKKYVDNGVLKYAWDIMIERTDPRYVAFQVDAFWSTDAFDDPSGAATAAFINKYPTRVKLMHVKDGINTTAQFNPSPTNSRGGSPRAFGTGEVDYRPILAAGLGKVQYYSQEQDGGTLTDAEISLTNLKGVGTAVVPTILGLPTEFAATAAGVQSSKAVTIKNTGDAAATITGIGLANSTNQNNQNAIREGERPGDFSIVSNTCVGSLAPNATCSVQVGFRPTSTGTRSVARVIVSSNADNATESILLTGSSNNDAQGGVGGDVPSACSR